MEINSINAAVFAKMFLAGAANLEAKKENLNAKFICQDIRTITFDKEFDVVLNMADGAIGYLEDDGENHKIFSVIAKALKNGGKHFMDIMNGSYAQTHFPCKLWDAPSKENNISIDENNILTPVFCNKTNLKYILSQLH